MGRCPDGQDYCQRKKLIEAGYVYVKGSGGDDGLAEDAEYFNLPPEILKRIRPDDFYIHYECWPAFELFQSCATQWRVAPMGERLGLDYSAVVSVAQFLGYGSEVFQQLRYLELGALTAYNGKALETLLDG